jgi:hypothetical protein
VARLKPKTFREMFMPSLNKAGYELNSDGYIVPVIDRDRNMDKVFLVQKEKQK